MRTKQEIRTINGKLMDEVEFLLRCRISIMESIRSYKKINRGI